MDVESIDVMNRILVNFGVEIYSWRLLACLAVVKLWLTFFFFNSILFNLVFVHPYLSYRNFCSLTFPIGMPFWPDGLHEGWVEISEWITQRRWIQRQKKEWCLVGCKPCCCLCRLRLLGNLGVWDFWFYLQVSRRVWLQLVPDSWFVSPPKEISVSNK